MGFGDSANIFQAQIMDLMASLEYVCAYINDLLIITRGVLDDHLLKIETVLTRCMTPDLKSIQPSHSSALMKLDILVTY